MKNKVELIGVIISILVGIVIVGLLSFRVLFLTFIDNYEGALKFNHKTGVITELRDKKGDPRIGYVFAWPIANSIYTIDLRPVQICISANSRVLNCKLVSFDMKGYAQFIEWHGIQDYSLPGDGGSGNLKDMLMSYAFDPDNRDMVTGEEYKFLKFHKGGENNENTSNN